MSARLLAHVDDVPAGRDLLGRERLVLGAAGDLLGDDHVDRQDDAARASPRRRPGSRARRRRRSGSARLLPIGLPCASRNVLAIPPPMTRMSTLVEEVLEDLDLVADLGAADDRRERLLGVLEELREDLDLALHQEARVGRQELRDADGRGVRAVGRAERVVDVDVGVARRAASRTPGRSSPPRRGSGGSRGAAARRAGAADASSVPTPSASPVTGTLRPSSWPSRSATGRSRRLSLDLAVGPAEVAGQDRRGRPAPSRCADGRAARPGSAESSVTLPSSSGTLKSTRTKTRLPAASRSRTVSLSMGPR